MDHTRSPYLLDHWKASLVGHSDANFTEDVAITVTFSVNYWKNLNSRTRFGHGHIHIFNKLFVDNDDGINARDGWPPLNHIFQVQVSNICLIGAPLLLQKNVWVGVDKPIYQRKRL